MTDRERWIVYPLLFLTLGIALRNQFLPTRRFGAVDLKAGEISAQKIICNDLEVRQKGECSQFQCGQIQFDQALGKYIRTAGLIECAQLKAGQVESRVMLVVDAEGKPAVMALADKNSQAGLIQTMNANGMPQVQIRSSESGGMVTTVGAGGKILVAMGQEGERFGVFAQIPQVGIFPLTLPLRIGTQSTLPKPPQDAVPVTPPQQTDPSTGNKTP